MNILAALAEPTARLVLYFGHGTSDEWTTSGTVTVDGSNVSAAKGKAVVSVACKTGRNLGPNAVNNGGIVAWLGFTIAVPVLPPHGMSDPIGDAIVNGVAKLASGTMADARAAIEAQLRLLADDYDTGGRYRDHPNADFCYFACGWLADNVSLSGNASFKPLTPVRRPRGPKISIEL
ncbi:hypothetical protein [Mycobacterium sp. Aquia_213]|uniref:hypothetical protein n=1 Tax=Mycobacterium sp. Aquia_213 TaxID=2991728 RepID=UPI002D1E42F3|nr:hypothetical protein [Mycobacterium sp. Aquia_213]